MLTFSALKIDTSGSNRIFPRPARIVASHRTNGQPDKTRPLCPVGQVAKYSGSGSTNDAANFSCVAEPIDISRR